MIWLYAYDDESAMVVTLLLVLASLSQAFSNVVVDAVLVIQSRRDPYLGSQDLMSVSWLAQGIAGVAGCCIAAFVLQDYHPKYAFLGHGVFGFILFVACFFLSADAERDYNEGEEPELTEFSSEYHDGQTVDQAARERRRLEAQRPVPGEEGFWYNFKRNMVAIWRSLQRREIYLVVIYFLVDGVLNPSFDDYKYFFLMNVVGISKFWFAMIQLIGQVCSVIGVILYDCFLKLTEVRTVLLWYVVIGVVAAWLAYCFAMRWNLEIGINDYVFIILSDSVFGSFAIAFSLLPILGLFAKITPRRIEGTMFAFFTGTWNLDQTVMQTAAGTLINVEFVGVDKDDQSGYSTLCLIGFFFQFFGFIYTFLIPLKKDVETWQFARET